MHNSSNAMCVTDVTPFNPGLEQKVKPRKHNERSIMQMRKVKELCALFSVAAFAVALYGASPAEAKANASGKAKAGAVEKGGPAAEPGDNGGVDSPGKPGQGPKSKDETNGKGQGLPDNKPGRDRTPDQSDSQQPGTQKPPVDKPGNSQKPGNGAPGADQPQNGCCNSCCNSAPGPKPGPGANPGPKTENGQKPGPGPKQEGNQGCQNAKPQQGENPGKEKGKDGQGGKPDTTPGMDKGKPGFDKAQHRNEHGKPDAKGNANSGPKNGKQGK
jgi:hypothetical protein